MEKNLYIDASHPDETRVVLKSDSHIEEYEYENKNKQHIKNNIYIGKVSRVEPSLQAAFVNYGRMRHGFLTFNDIQSDYYQIPHDDKIKLKKEEEDIREQLKKESKQIEETQNQNNEGEINENNINSKNENPIQNQQNDTNNLKKRFHQKRYKIQEVIKPNQIILVQVLKEERGQKGAALTTFISLAGKYTVLMPNTPKGGGISRKIFNSDDRKKIRNILQEITVPPTMGIIVRTAGSNKTKNEINTDLNNTINVWEEIKDKAIRSIAPALVYEEGDIIKRALRDMCDNDTKNIVVEGNEGYQKAKNFVKTLMPQKSKFVKKYRGKIPLFHSMNIEHQLNKIFEPVIKLASGGYIVINPTEALISIDINSGRSNKEINVERTAISTNLEAAEEIARQIKLRDLSGLLVIDFIDMINFYNRRLVEKKLREKLKDDKARIQFGRISNFGLLEMSRQRMRESSIKWNMNLSLESFSLKIIKKAEELAFSNKIKIINLTVPDKVKTYMEEVLKKEINYFKKRYHFELNLMTNKNLMLPEYQIELLNRNKKVVKKVENIEKMNQENKDKYSNNFNKKGFKKNRFKNYGFKKKRKIFSKKRHTGEFAQNY